MCLKICHISPLKLKTHIFRGLHTHEVTCVKSSKVQNLFCGKSLVAKQSQDNRESLCVNFVFSSFVLTYFRKKHFVTSFSWKCLWRSFWRKHEKFNLTKNLKHESIKTLSKTYKILKKFFRFDWHAIEHTHHIWSCTIT